MADDGFIKIIDDTNELIKEALSHSEINGDWEQRIVSTKTTLQEVEEMIIELNLKGSLRERPNGLIEFRTPKLGSVYGRTKEEINNKIIKRLNELQSHVKKPQRKRKAKTPLLSEFYSGVYLPYKKSKKRSESTLSGYESNMRFIIDSGFDKPLSEYISTEIEDFLFSIPETRKRQIVQGFLNNVFTRAVVKSVIKENPCAFIDKMEHETNEGSALDFAEQESFFGTLLNDEKTPHTQKCYLIFVYLTGSRRNEALAVRESDVDLERKILHLPGTKTDGSDRYIPLFPLVENLLRSMTPTNGLYFPFSDRTANETFKQCIKGHKLHDLRHTFGTIQYCCNKVDIKTVSLWMGHSTIDTTLRIYTHPEQLDKATFLRGDLTEEEKNAVLRSKYEEILRLLYSFLE